MLPPPAGWRGRLGRLRQRWREPSLTMLLVMQGLTIFVFVPADAAGLGLPPGVAGLPQFVFMAFAILMSPLSWTLWAGLATMLMVVAGQLILGRLGGLADLLMGGAVGAATHVLLIAAIAGAVFGPGRFTRHRLQGSVLLYLNIALLFAILHRVVAELVPGAYTNLPNPFDQAQFRAATDYLSFSTITSVGYGDIVPVHPLARGMAMLEAVTGQVFPATLLARVVAMSMARRHDGAEP
jgi:hypothetical protein